ncbi:MAG: DNA-packaging protein [Tannerellaceae bacterium]|nr:DNA-packaging protein [Tannerellaceae bacterium]
MPVPDGNQSWELRCKHAPAKLFASSRLLWKAATGYFRWCDNHPWVTRKNKQKANGTETDEAPVQRPYSLAAFLLYIALPEAEWEQRKQTSGPEVRHTMERIESVIDTQLLEGALTGAFNASLVARKLGLADKQEHTGKDGTPLASTVNIRVVRTREEAKRLSIDS